MPIIRKSINDEYWHIGETAMRLRKVMSLILSGSNSFVIGFNVFMQKPES